MSKFIPVQGDLFLGIGEFFNDLTDTPEGERILAAWEKEDSVPDRISREFFSDVVKVRTTSGLPPLEAVTLSVKPD